MRIFNSDKTIAANVVPTGYAASILELLCIKYALKKKY